MTIQQQIQFKLKEAKEKWQNEEISSSFFAQLFFVLSGFSLYGADWISSKNFPSNFKEIDQIKEDFRYPKIIENLLLPDIKVENQKLITKSIISYLKFRKISCKINQALIQWENGCRKLKLLDYVPSAEKVLSLQANGERVVSILDEEQFRKIKEKNPHHRNNFDFFLHDLHHSEKFFESPFGQEIQVKFYNFLNLIIHHPQLTDLRKSNKKFSSQFDYLISDMNTHPIHQIKYFKAIFNHAGKNDSEWIDLFSSLTLPLSTIKAFEKINTLDETKADHLHLFHFIENSMTI